MEVILNQNIRNLSNKADLVDGFLFTIQQKTKAGK